MKRFSFVKLSFMCLIFTIFVIPFKTNAVTNLIGNSGTMGYYINGSYGRAVQFSGNFPIELLTSYSGYYKYLYGVESTFDLSNEFSGTYVNNGAYVYMQLHRGGSQGVMDWTQSNINMRYVSNSHNGVEKQGTCSIHSANNQYITYKCQVEYTNNDYPTTIYMKIGETANFTYNVQPYIGRTMLTDDTSSLYLQAMYFNAYSTNNEEPGTGGSSTDLTDTNEKIDDVKDSVDDVKEEIQSIGDTLTDTDVDSSLEDFEDTFMTIGDTPTTQPLSDIVNMPLDYLRNVVNSSACERLYLTIPYFNTSIQIPCIQQYLSTNFNSSVVDLIKLVVNSLLIYKVVISFWVFLNDLRDPNNDDLEVIDL